MPFLYEYLLLGFFVSFLSGMEILTDYNGKLKLGRPYLWAVAIALSIAWLPVIIWYYAIYKRQ